MSIIGTRPPLISETNFYELHHRARLAIKPGITGMWQVSGRSDITDFEEVVRLDKEYNEGLSMIFGNTEKGCCIISSIDTMVKNETSLETIYEEKQPHLFRPLKDCTSEREEFWDDYHKKGWKYVTEKYAE